MENLSLSLDEIIRKEKREASKGKGRGREGNSFAYRRMLNRVAPTKGKGRGNTPFAGRRPVARLTKWDDKPRFLDREPRLRRAGVKLAMNRKFRQAITPQENIISEQLRALGGESGRLGVRPKGNPMSSRSDTVRNVFRKRQNYYRSPRRPYASDFERSFAAARRMAKPYRR